MKYTFDDVLIEPQFNVVKSRRDVDLKTMLFDVVMDIPVISSNMDTVTEVEMAIAMRKNGGIGCLHRFYPEIINKMNDIKQVGFKNVIVAVGLSDLEFNKAKEYIKIGCNKICIDVAHGASNDMVRQCAKIKAYARDINVPIYIIVGNFASHNSLKLFLDCFPTKSSLPDCIKIGIGPGSVCTTRIKTGCGYPQLSAIEELSKLAHSWNINVIADGGMKTPGDIAKALGAGADFVMLGGMLAGTDETPGKLDFDDGLYKFYRGSASKESYDAQGKDDSWRTEEGKLIKIKYKGSVKSVLQDIEGGLRSACTYVGAHNLDIFRKNVNFIRVTNATKVENG